jgi:hypothetical protein
MQIRSDGVVIGQAPLDCAEMATHGCIGPLPFSRLLTVDDSEDRR